METPPRWMAFTNRPSPRLESGERTYVAHDPIDYGLALHQHDGYCEALRRCGVAVTTLAVNQDCADGVFIEDTAIALDEIAVMMSPGAESRRSEVAALEVALRPHRAITNVRLPGTIDGGDVVRSGRDLYVGLSPRTNAEGIAALRDIVAPFGYRVMAIPVRRCLHLKTACSALPDGRFLVNADWIDVSPLPASSLVHVPDDEPWAGDVLAIDDHIIMSDAFPRTRELLSAFDVVPVSVSEFAKAEGGVTCLSLVFRPQPLQNRVNRSENQ